MAQAVLVAGHGHLGQKSEAQSALARYHELTPLPIEDAVLGFLKNPAQIELFRQGVALAVGRPGPESETAG